MEEHVVLAIERKRGWNLAGEVTKLRVELRPKNYPSGSIFDVVHRKMDGWETEDNRDTQLDAGATRLKRFFETDALVCAMSTMPKLESLIIALYESWCSNGPTWDYQMADEERRGKRLRLDLMQSVREGLVRTFADIELNKLDLEHLTYLRLTLPVAYDFACINKHMPDTVVLRLRNLYLEFVDATGPGGDLAYTISRQGDSDSDGDEDYPFPNLQREFPNTAYMHDMCELINRCRNLESLGLIGTQCVSLEGLDLRPTNGGLRNVYLSRAVATLEKMQMLLSPGKENAPVKIEAFGIQEVQLMNETWETFFADLLAAPSLLYFHVWNLVYNKYGESAHLAEFNNRPWENSSVIWTENYHDKERLHDVIRAVQERGGSVTEEMVLYVCYNDART